jgi:hypothetical protein
MEVHRRTGGLEKKIVIDKTQSQVRQETHYTDIRLWVFLSYRMKHAIPIRSTIVSRRTKGSDSVFLSTNILDLQEKKYENEDNQPLLRRTSGK